MILRRAAAALAVALLLLAGCSLEYDLLDDDDDSGRPELELSDLRHTVVRSGRVQLQVHAEHSRTFQEAQRQELIDVYFWEYDADGEIAAEGRADSAGVQLESEDITFSGDIQLYSHLEEAGVLAEYLAWSGETRRLQGREGDQVVINRDDGSTIRGTGFLADMRHRSLDFRGEVDGVFVDTPAKKDPTDTEEEGF